jgi:hypothetical protein
MTHADVGLLRDKLRSDPEPDLFVRLEPDVTTDVSDQPTDSDAASLLR